MHELAVASSIIETVTAEFQKRKLKSITAVGLRIGPLAGVDKDALTFGYDVLTKETILAGSHLKIELVPVKATCKSCRKDFAVSDFLFLCPHCGSSLNDVNHGDELEIVYLEGE